MKNQVVDLFLDSGAYSASTQGITINLDEYIDFIKSHEKHLAVYANLDVIGDPVATLKNQRIMEEAGLCPLPCFHFGEDFRYLHYYMENYDYIAMGGMVGRKSRDLSSWLDKCFNLLCDNSDRVPKIKVHGYGMTSILLMIRYPWYSVDSTSWVVQSRLGDILIPRADKNGELIYDDRSLKISISNRSPNMNTKDDHYKTLSPHVKAHVDRYIKNKGYVIGKSSFKNVPETYELKEDEKWAGKAVNGKRDVEKILEPGLSNDYKKRDELNVIYFLDLEKHLQPWPWPFKAQESGFGL